MNRRRFAAALALVIASATGAVPAPAAAAHQPCLPFCNFWVSHDGSGPANEVHVAVDPADPDHAVVVAKDYRGGPSNACHGSVNALHVGVGVYVTFDRGDTWQVTQVPLSPARGNPLPYPCASDPVVAIDAQGRAYVTFLNVGGNGNNAVAVARSADGGLSWPVSDLRVVHVEGGDDKTWGTVDASGRFHVVWRNPWTGLVRYARDDGAFQFGPPVVLGHEGAGDPGPVVVTGLADRVYVFWRDGSSILVRRSDDAGAQFGPVQAVQVEPPIAAYDIQFAPEPRLPFFPAAAVDADPGSPTAGRVHLVWQDQGGVGTSAIHAAYSDDGAASWSPVHRLDTPGAASRVALPAVAVAPGGRVDVAWLRDDDLGEHFLAYAASSHDGGDSWTPDAPVQAEPLTTDWSRNQAGAVFIGDYIGVASAAEHTWVAFAGSGSDRAGELPPDALMRSDAYAALVPHAVAVQFRPDLDLCVLGICFKVCPGCPPPECLVCPPDDFLGRLLDPVLGPVLDLARAAKAAAKAAVAGLASGLSGGPGRAEPAGWGALPGPA